MKIEWPKSICPLHCDNLYVIPFSRRNLHL